MEVIINKSSTFLRFFGLNSSIAFNVTLCAMFERRSSNISARPCAFPVSDPYNNVIARFSGWIAGSFCWSIVSVSFETAPICEPCVSDVPDVSCWFATK